MAELTLDQATIILDTTLAKGADLARMMCELFGKATITSVVSTLRATVGKASVPPMTSRP